MSKLSEIPFFNHLKGSKNILLAGAGGGFDIYSGIPVYFALKELGYNVTLANYSFTSLNLTNAEQVFPACYLVKSSSRSASHHNYFPEKYLCEWFLTKNSIVDMYAFDRTGVVPLRNAYDYLVAKHEIDTIILVDGGTDSLMFGDEEGLGTPEEDISSMAAAFKTKVKKKYLLSLGFGVDHFHGVSHFRFLENVAELIKDGGYLGLFQVMKEMEEGQNFNAAVEYANIRMKERESIVANSIKTAIEGEHGDFHSTERTKGSELWINPLMSIYWRFELDAVMKKNKYYDRIKNTKSIHEVSMEIARYKRENENVREKKQLPI